MRLPLLSPSGFSPEQKALYDDIMEVVDAHFGNFVVKRKDGALMGPFNAMLHFPVFGRAAWAMNRTMYDNTKLPSAVLQVAVLVTGSKLGARYQIYGHEHLAKDAGVSAEKIATIVAGQRPTDLTREEAVAYDVAAALNRDKPLPSSVYKAGEEVLGKEGMAELIYLVGCFHLIAIILNGYAVPVPDVDDWTEGL
jgi:alkylhydroperoxidase family enzyme